MWEALSSTFFNVCDDGGADAYGRVAGEVQEACGPHAEIEHNVLGIDLTFVDAHLKWSNVLPPSGRGATYHLPTPKLLQ